MVREEERIHSCSLRMDEEKRSRCEDLGLMYFFFSALQAP